MTRCVADGDGTFRQHERGRFGPSVKLKTFIGEAAAISEPWHEACTIAPMPLAALAPLLRITGCGRTWLLLLILLGTCLEAKLSAAEPAVAVLYGSAWSPGDAARDGAAEFEILLCAARVRQTTPLAGIVGVGARQGSFPPAAELALERVAHMGIPIVRVAQTGTLSANDGDVFIEAGSLTPADAKRVLSECLQHYGPLPSAADPMRPTKNERAAIRTKLVQYQRQFDARNANQLAMR